MADNSRAEIGDTRGEPAAQLQLDSTTATPGQQLHIRLLGPAGGIATVAFIPLSPPETGNHEGPDLG